MSHAIRAKITAELGVEPVLINSALVSAQNRQRLYWAGKRNPDGTYSQVTVEQPADRGILLQDILGAGMAWREKAYTLKANYHKASAVNAVDGGHFPAPMAAEPVRIGTIENDAKSNAVIVGHQSRLVIEDAAIFQNPHGFNKGGVKYEKTPTLTANGDWPHNNFLIETADGKTYPVYEVRSGIITIKGKQYPKKLADGFYIIRKLTVRECMRLQTVPETYVFPVSPSQAYKMLGNGWTVDIIAHIMSHFDGLTTDPVEVLSMYDGMSCGHIALDKLGAKILRYYAMEIDKYAIKTTQQNFPDTVQLGDAFQVRDDAWEQEFREGANADGIYRRGTG